MNRTATFTLSEIDFRHALRCTVLGSYKEIRTILRLLFIWLCSVLIVGIVVLVAGEPIKTLYHSLPELAFWLAVVAFVTPLAIPLLFGRIAIRRRLRQDKLVSLPVSVRWNEETYDAEQPGIQNQIKWQDYFKLREDRHVFLFFISSYYYQILPKRSLTRDQIEDIQGIIAAI